MDIERVRTVISDATEGSQRHPDIIVASDVRNYLLTSIYIVMKLIVDMCVSLYSDD